jgi:hypothetical protein
MAMGLVPLSFLHKWNIIYLASKGGKKMLIGEGSQAIFGFATFLLLCIVIITVQFFKRRKGKEKNGDEEQ